MSEEIVYEDIFTVSDVKKGNYERTERLICKSNDAAGDMSFDVNMELCADFGGVGPGDQIQLAVVVVTHEGTSAQNQLGYIPEAAGPYPYCAYGQFYGPTDAVGKGKGYSSVRISCGGLLFIVTAPDRKLARLAGAKASHTSAYVMFKK